LDRLVKNLSEGGTSKFPSISQFINTEHGGDPDKLALLLRKGVYPYDALTSIESFSQGLPSREEFHNKLTDEPCSDADWEHVNRIWDAFQCRTLADLCEIYCKSDVLLLVDVVNNYRLETMKNYGLEALHYFSAPG
jgi:hypothetical protein